MENRQTRHSQRINIITHNISEEIPHKIKSENELIKIKNFKNASTDFPNPDDSDDLARINRNNLLRAASDSYSRNPLKPDSQRLLKKVDTEIGRYKGDDDQSENNKLSHSETRIEDNRSNSDFRFHKFSTSYETNVDNNEYEEEEEVSEDSIEEEDVYDETPGVENSESDSEEDIDEILHVSEPLEDELEIPNDPPYTRKSSSSRAFYKGKEPQKIQFEHHHRNKSENNFFNANDSVFGNFPFRLDEPLILSENSKYELRHPSGFHFDPDFQPDVDSVDIPTTIHGFSPEQQFDKLMRIKKNQNFAFTDDPRIQYKLIIPAENHIGSPEFEPSLLPSCEMCHEKCRERCYFAHGFSYHPQCFKCTSCKRHLRPPKCVFMMDRPYCQHCIRMKKNNTRLNRCCVCGLIIYDQNDEVRSDCYNEQPMHKSCFRCYHCSDEMTLMDDYTLVSGKPVCSKCIDNLTKSGFVCNKCGKVILDRSVEFHGMRFHPEHFVCSQCKTILKGQNYVVYRNKPYCPTHGDAFATRKCWVCHGDFSENQKVIRWDGRAYHADCFKCKVCQVVLNEDNWIRVHGFPYCEKCYQEYCNNKTVKMEKKKKKPIKKRLKKTIKQ